MDIEASKYPDTSSQLDIIRECLDYGWTDIVVTFPYLSNNSNNTAWEYILQMEHMKAWLEAQGACHKQTYRVIERQIISPNARTEYHWLFEDPKHATLFSLRWV